MRQESKQERNVQLARVQGWHEGGRGWHDESYAFRGYDGNYYFTSDRKIPLSEDFRREDGKPMKGYGLEIEVESWGIKDRNALAEVMEKIVFPHFPQGLFKMQSDSSLHGGECAVECITQPITKEGIRNNYSAFKVMYNKYFKAFDMSAERSGNCGMHVNISVGNFGATEEAQEENIRKLFYLINHHYEFFLRALMRKPDHTHYASRMYEDAWTMNVHGFDTDHGVCFNLGHYDAGRIELRIVGGQKDYGAFRNTMEVVFHLVERVKKISRRSCDDLVAVFKGCNKYVYDRLESKCAEFLTDAQLAEIRETVTEETLL